MQMLYYDMHKAARQAGLQQSKDREVLDSDVVDVPPNVDVDERLPTVVALLISERAGGFKGQSYCIIRTPIEHTFQIDYCDKIH
jgi:hypothetical protein